MIIALLADLQDAYDLPTAGLGLVAGVAFVTAFIGYIWFSRYADRGHAKVMLIDGERAVIGSANLDQRSFHRNYEINCVVDNIEFGGQIRELLLEDIGGSRRVRLDVHERRGVLTRAMERIVSLFAWFL